MSRRKCKTSHTGEQRPGEWSKPSLPSRPRVWELFSSAMDTPLVPERASLKTKPSGRMDWARASHACAPRQHWRCAWLWGCVSRLRSSEASHAWSAPGETQGQSQLTAASLAPLVPGARAQQRPQPSLVEIKGHRPPVDQNHLQLTGHQGGEGAIFSSLSSAGVWRSPLFFSLPWFCACPALQSCVIPARPWHLPGNACHGTATGRAPQEDRGLGWGRGWSLQGFVLPLG